MIIIIVLGILLQEMENNFVTGNGNGKLLHNTKK